MSRTRKLLLGAASVWPLLYIPLFTAVAWSLFGGLEGGEPPNLGIFFAIFAVHGLTILGALGVMGFFVIHVIRDERLPMAQRVIWMVLLLAATLFAIPAYWYLRIWRDGGPTTEEPSGAPLAKGSLLVLCLLACGLGQVGCDHQTPPAEAQSQTAPTTSRTTEPEATAPTNPTPEAPDCDVSLQAGNRRFVEVDPSTSYCVQGAVFARNTSMEEARAALSEPCDTTVAIGATELTCGEVTLVFAGPVALLSQIRIEP